MTKKAHLPGLTKREQQIMDILYREGPLTNQEIQAFLPDELNNATVRSVLRTMENKGFIKHKKRYNHFVYSPVEDRTVAAKNAIDKLIHVFFSGKPTDAVASLIDQNAEDLSGEELEELIQLIENFKKEK